MDTLLSPAELAEYLNVTRATVYTWNSQGIGPPAFRVGNQIRFRREDVDRWLEERPERTGTD